jgi:pilus assembly protein CpaE
MHNDVIHVKIAGRHSSIIKKLEEIVSSTGGYQVQKSGDNQKPDLLIFELGQNTEKDFRIIESLLDSRSVGNVFLLSESTEKSVLIKAIKIGAKEFFTLPLEEQEIRVALVAFKSKNGKSNQKESNQSGRIIDVIGSKGGVGTTTVAVNLAVSLARNKNTPSVALVDLNMLFGEIPIFLAFKPNYHWGEITKDISRLDNTFLMNILSKHSSGVYILPSPHHLNGDRPCTPGIIEHLFGLMQKTFDFVVVDSGQSLNDTSLKVLEMSTEVLLISLLSLPGLANTNKLLTSFHNLSYLPKDRIRIVINRYLKKSTISIEDAEETINRKIFWTIPNDYKTTMAAINDGKALFQFASKAPVTKSLNELAAALIPGQEKGDKKSWAFFK